MFSKKEDSYEAAKVALKIAARRYLAAQPGIIAAIHVICSFQEETDFSGIAAEILDKNTDLFKKDPLLKADVIDLLDLLGLNSVTIEVPKVKALMKVLCGMV